MKNCSLPESNAFCKRFQKEAAEQTGENPDGQKETRPARDPALAIG